METHINTQNSAFKIDKRSSTIFDNPVVGNDGALVHLMDAYHDAPAVAAFHSFDFSPLSGDYQGMDSVMFGDYDEDGGIVVGDPISISNEDFQEIASGAPLARVVSRKAQNRIQADGNVRKAAVIGQAASLTVPGAAAAISSFEPLFVENGNITQFGTTSKVPGSGLIANINKWRAEYPNIMTQIRGVGDAQMADVTLKLDATNAAQLGYDGALMAVPFLFLSLTSTANSIRVGARYTITMTARSEKGLALTSDKFSVEWKNTTRPLKVTLIPYLRLKESLLPLLAAFGTSGSTPVNISITIGGMGLGDSVELTCPGVDSEESARLLKSFNII